MLVLIWATLLFSVRGNSADAGSSPTGKKCCQNTHHFIPVQETEITSEAGLCVVIPCSFTVAAGFDGKSVIWYKCDPADKNDCKSDTPIFNSSNNGNAQSGFRGRVSQLEPDMSQKNCSIIINDLMESDSGSYRLRVTGPPNQKTDDCTFNSKATIKVTALSQKPEVTIPPLTEGQQTTLTCTAPGLCSGSDPQITWTWRGAGENGSHITGNITDFKTENLTAVTQRHSSTLTFNASTEHHGTSVTCKVSFTGNATTEETVTLTFVEKSAVTGMTPNTTGKVITTVTGHENNPTTILTVKGHNSTVAKCVSGNENKTAKENCTKPTADSKQSDLLTKLLGIVKQPQVIIAFLIGILLSATICCLIGICKRKKQRGSGNLAENLEMVTTQAVPLIDDGQAVNDDDWTHDLEAAEGGASAMEPKEVEYSNIDFSVLKQRSPSEAETQDPGETEYAEIKKEPPVEGQDNAGDESVVLEGNKEEEAMIGVNKGTEQFMPAKEEGNEDVALYSSVNKTMVETG